MLEKREKECYDSYVNIFMKFLSWLNPTDHQNFINVLSATDPLLLVEGFRAFGLTSMLY